MLTAATAPAAPAATHEARTAAATLPLAPLALPPEGGGGSVDFPADTSHEIFGPAAPTGKRQSHPNMTCRIVVPAFSPVVPAFGV